MSVLGKVGNINEISTVRLGKQSLLAEGTIADLTGKITISLSEDNLALITTAAVYKITNIRVRFWNDAKKLTTIPIPSSMPFKMTRSRLNHGRAFMEFHKSINCCYSIYLFIQIKIK